MKLSLALSLALAALAFGAPNDINQENHALEARQIPRVPQRGSSGFSRLTPGGVSILPSEFQILASYNDPDAPYRNVRVRRVVVVFRVVIFRVVVFVGTPSTMMATEVKDRNVNCLSTTWKGFFWRIVSARSLYGVLYGV
ncbi:hypothetical protein DM02DRAFT_620810 [Periconia macrospinosa]|uniref:Uncharacterized protein n=1 Tax=Periconia macrospinosa TaxID=97972 RepID=A0A2V1D072_9PLEO|nr:hypothetical protein DM02DRAFT_620810 [Periconia macrospinosa]